MRTSSEGLPPLRGSLALYTAGRGGWPTPNEAKKGLLYGAPALLVLLVLLFKLDRWIFLFERKRTT